MSETTRPLVTDEAFNAFEVALDRQTWPDPGCVRPPSRRQMVAVRAALDAVTPEWRARWVADALDEIAGQESHLKDCPAWPAMCRHTLLRLAAEYRAGAR